MFFTSVYVLFSISWFLNSGIFGSTSPEFLMLALLVSLVVNKNKVFYFRIICLYPSALFFIEKQFYDLLERYPSKTFNEIDILFGSFVVTTFTYILVVYYLISLMMYYIFQKLNWGNFYFLIKNLM